MIKHFFKVLSTFIMMIVLGLLGIYVVNTLDARTKNEPKPAVIAEDCKISDLC